MQSSAISNPSIQGNRALQALQARAARVGGAAFQQKFSEVSKTETFNQIITFSCFDLLTLNEKGLKLLNSVIDLALQQIQKYRTIFIENSKPDKVLNLKMIEVRSLVNFLKDTKQGLLSLSKGTSLYK